MLNARYEVFDPVDTGTLADVRVAYDTLLQRKVTVKLAKEGEEWRSGHYPRGSFKKEAVISAALQHPYLLPVYDHGSYGEYQYLVMRFFDATLNQYLCSGKTMPLDVALPLFRSLAEAIDYLHESGPIVHGNLKPNTIVLDTTSGSRIHPFIYDFGVAALGARGIGTPLYMAPEQLEQDPSPAADLFALGIVFYECLVGQTPFTADSIPSLMFQKVQPEPGQYSVRRARPELPLGVDVVLERLTRPEPRERYASATAAVEDMTRAFYSGGDAVKGTVFVCYAREDQAYAHDLARRLRDIGIRLWIDRDIAPGSNWDRSVEEALRAADAMLVIMSPAAAASDNVRDEWSYFLEHGKAVYPLVWQPCDLPLRLHRRQYVTSTGDVVSDMTRVVEMLTSSEPPRSTGH